MLVRALLVLCVDAQEPELETGLFSVDMNAQDHVHTYKGRICSARCAIDRSDLDHERKYHAWL